MSSQPPAQTAVVKGIDVSHFQGSINWAQVKGAGCSFAYAKATEGIGIVDPFFASHWNVMKEAGLIRGAYHFFRPAEDAAAQASHFVQTVSLAPDDLPPVIDLEVSDGVSNAALVEGVQTWLDAVEQQMGRTPMIYTNHSFWEAHMTAQFGRYPLWIAHYAPSPQPLPSGWSEWTFWQYSQSLGLAGVHGNVDHDQFNGSPDDLQAFIQSTNLQQQSAAAPPAPAPGDAPTTGTS